MILYCGAVIFPFIVYFVYDRCFFIRKKEHLKKIRLLWIIAALLPMYLLIALRGPSIGADTGVYREMFSSICQKSFVDIFDNSTIEPGFTLFEWFISLFTHDSKVYQVIYSTIYLVSVAFFINSFEKNNFLLAFLFATIGPYKFMFTGVRQCLGICFCLFAYRPLKNRNIFAFFLFVIIGFSFHKSVILFAPVYFIYNTRTTARNLIIFSVVSVIVIAIILPTQQYISWIFGYDYGTESVKNGFISFAVYLAVVIYICYFYKCNGLSKEQVGLFNISLLVLDFWVLRLFSRIAERPSYYFLPYLIALLSQVVTDTRSGCKKENNLLLVLVCVCCLFMFMYKMNSGLYVPYEVF